MKKSILLLLACLLLGWGSNLFAKNGVIRVVVLGSSTAAGSGPTNSANAWVNQYRKHVQSLNSSSEVINLAAGYYTTYHVMPTGFVPTDGTRPLPDTARNITKALSYAPDAIIINLPTNDATNAYTVNEQLFNYQKVLAIAKAKNVPVWIATPQPRNLSVELRQNLKDMRDSTNKYLADKAIDFWTDIAAADGTINPLYDFGDGVHLNDSAHHVLFNRVLAENILNNARADNDLDTINIDFGTTLTAGAWNNLDGAYADTILNMVNSQNQKTGFNLWIHDPFTGVNVAGTTAPDAALNLPSTSTSDSFFGSVGAHGGVMEPTGGVTISGLSLTSKYSFTIFASRAGITDNRETMYIIKGKSIDTIYLDPANNTAKVAIVANKIPADNGTIQINVGPGPNNTNALKYYFMGTVRMTSMSKVALYDKDGVINLDLGGKLSPAPWNNLAVAQGSELISDLINTEGNSTGYTCWVHDPFTGINEFGTTSPDASLGFDSNVSSDCFFGSTGLHSGVIEATGGITFGNLSTTTNYSLTFFGSRDGVTDNRETKYAVTGATTQNVYLDAANNKKNLVSTTNLLPASNGTITVVASPGPNNTNSLHYFYLGMVRLTYAPVGTALQTTTLQETIGVDAVAYPNPFTDRVALNCSLQKAGDLQVRIYNLQGQLLRSFQSNDLQAGVTTVDWDATNQFGTKVQRGIYVCRISLSTSEGVYATTQKLMLK